jgi:putative phage-type endonuclease
MTPDERADWLAWRRTGVGASDVAGILGLSPWASPWSIWADKTGLVVDDSDSLAMEFGRRAEQMIAPWFTAKTGLYVAGEQTRCTGDQVHHICTIDGHVHEYDLADRQSAPWDHTARDALGVLEIKTTRDTPKEWAENGAPIQYKCQGQWAMHVTGTDHLWFAVLHMAYGAPDLHVYEMTRDQDDIATLVEAVDRFWWENVQTGVPPEADAHRATTWATKHQPASVGDMIELDDTTAVDVARLGALKATRKSLDTKIDELENRVRATLGECTEGYAGGQLVVSHRQQSRAGHVVGPSTFRKFLLHNKKETP